MSRELTKQDLEAVLWSVNYVITVGGYDQLSSRSGECVDFRELYQRVTQAHADVIAQERWESANVQDG